MWVYRVLILVPFVGLAGFGLLVPVLASGELGEEPFSLAQQVLWAVPPILAIAILLLFWLSRRAPPAGAAAPPPPVLAATLYAATYLVAHWLTGPNRRAELDGRSWLVAALFGVIGFGYAALAAGLNSVLAARGGTSGDY